MAEIAPFRGILYALPSGGDVSALIAPPYDVISEPERAALEQRSPYNCVRLILPRDEQGGDGEGRYAVAAATLRAWLDAGVLRRDPQPALYRYHQVFTPPGAEQGKRVVRRGFIARMRLHRFEERIILPHERTLAGPKADRLKLKRAVRMHLSQIFGLYRDPTGAADAAFARIEQEPPERYGVTADGTEHRLWRLTDRQAQEQVMAALRDKTIYIADGHHRYETMLALREELRREPSYIGYASSVEYGTIFLCEAHDPGLLVFPTHRILHGLPHFDFADLLRRAASFFCVDEVAPPSPVQATQELAARGRQAPTLLVVSDGRAAYLSLRPEADLLAVEGLAGPAVLRRLDVTLLHAVVLEGLLGIDRAAQEAQTHLRYVKDTAQALAAAHEPGVQAVWLMNPTPVAQVMEVCDAGLLMPQKSTYFFPKIASGLVLNPLDPAEPVETVAGRRPAA
ncbi:MAG: DUF1015 domain-containing protein [Myxococcales bacterium]|nr:DUF1015 domain-containing protein [Myxococcota bacterium]MDW8284306.1 DUF1015 domain-containing protein [Myxococcales bacterium]